MPAATQGQSGPVRVRYSFEVAGQKYGGEARLPAYPGPSRSGPCNVTYLPGKPQVHTLGSASSALHGHEQTVLVYLVLALVAVGGLLAAVLGASGWELWLARHGQSILATTLRRETQKKEDGRTLYWVEYRYEVPGCLPRTAWTRVSPALYEYLPPGTPITLLYHPRFPTWHRPSFALRLVTLNV